MYGELAGWWPLISPTSDYAGEAAFLGGLLRGAETVLELGSGGGNVAWHLKGEFLMTLSDLSEGMLAQSRAQNPELEHVRGDMRTLRLGRRFDAVLIHDAIMYMTTERDLYSALLTAGEHLRPGGTAVVVPDFVLETFRPETRHEGADAGDRAVRYLEWTWDPDPGDTLVNYDLVFALREGEELRTVVDRQVVGVFPRATWLRLMGEAGLVGARSLPDPSGGGERLEVFVARAP